METRRKPIGEILIAGGIIERSHLESALLSQRGSGNRLASECFVRGIVEERPLVASLSIQTGVPGVGLTDLVLPLHCLSVVPEAVAIQRLALPVRADDERVFLAMADPDEGDVAGEVAFLARRQVIVCVALHRPLLETISSAYSGKRRGELEYRGALAANEDTGAEQVELVCADEVTEVPRDLAVPALAAANVSGQGEIPVDVEGGDLDGDVKAADESRARPAARGGPPPRGPDAPLRALVVEDDEDLRALLARALRGEGMVVEEAARGLEALKRVRTAPPDLLILDAMLPELHGFEIAKKIRASDEYDRMPIAMLSSVYRGWRFARDLKDVYGVDVFLEKPFNVNVLLDALRRVLAVRLRRPIKQRPTAAAVQEIYREGLALHRAGDLEGAIERFREALQLDPLSARLHFQLGVLYLMRGAEYRAMQELEEAVALEPDFFEALRSLAILYQQKGFKKNALSIWERALQSSPEEDMRERIRSHLVTLIEADWK